MTLENYEIPISARCLRYENISNSAILKHRHGHSVILPSKLSVVLGPSALPKQFLGMGWSFTFCQGPLLTGRLNGSVLHNKVGKLQTIFP